MTNLATVVVPVPSGCLTEKSNPQPLSLITLFFLFFSAQSGWWIPETCVASEHLADIVFCLADWCVYYVIGCSKMCSSDPTDRIAASTPQASSTFLFVSMLNPACSWLVQSPSDRLETIQPGAFQSGMVLVSREFRLGNSATQLDCEVRNNQKDGGSSDFSETFGGGNSWSMFATSQFIGAQYCFYLNEHEDFLGNLCFFIKKKMLLFPLTFTILQYWHFTLFYIDKRCNP